METMSIWHWLIALAVFAVPVGIGFIGVTLNTGAATLTRGGFAMRVVILIFGGTIVSSLIPGEWIAGAVALLIGIAVWVMVPYWAVDRLRNIGNPNRKLAVITVIPLIGLFYIFYLMLAASRAPAPDAASMLD